MTTENPLIWLSFNLFIVCLLILDALFLAPINKRLSSRRAMLLTGFWISLALIFNLVIYIWLGHKSALEFFTGYLIEQSLSIDNLFVFLLIFSHFKISALHQRKILFWGIIGAQIMRAIFILAGVALLNAFSWIVYIFGAMLIYCGFKMFFEKEKEVHPETNPVIKIFHKIMPVTHDDHGGKFVVKENGVRMATHLLVVLILVETTDLIFALDSIPAILAITKDPFIVYTSNIFAILGLRAMYFALASFMTRFHHLHYALGAILVFVGIKMVIEGHVHIPIPVTLGFIVLALSISVMTSLMFPAKGEEKPHA
jgi:tellurite resistance protein TerC